MTVLVQHLRAASAESTLVQAVARLIAGVREGRPGASDGSASSFEAVVIGDRLAQSRLAGATGAILQPVVRAWDGSFARDGLQTLANAIPLLTVTQRIRLAGIWMVAAAATDAALTLLDPRPAYAARWALWALGVAIGVGAAIGAQPVQMAWSRWRQAR